LHIKIKHNGGNKTDREKIAKNIVQARLNGQSLPDLEVNLPPGAVERAAQQVGLIQDENFIQDLEKQVTCIDEKKKQKKKNQTEN